MNPHSRLSPLFILFLAAFVDMVGFGIVMPVLPLYAERYHADAFTIGFLLALYSGAGFIFSPLVGMLSDRYGRKPVLLLSTIGQAAGFYMMAGANSLVWLFVARLIDGAFGANVSTTQAYVADVTRPEQRSRAMGLLGAAFASGFICGPLLGGVLSQISPAAPFIFAGSLAALNAGLIWFVLPETFHRPDPTAVVKRHTIFEMVRRPPVAPLIVAYFFLMTGFSILTAFFAIFAEDRFQFGAAQTGYLFAGIGVIGVVVQALLIDRAVQKFGEKGTAIIGLIFVGIGIFVLPSANQIATLLAVSGALAVGNSLVNPTLNGLVSTAVPPDWQGRVLGVMQAGASLGRCLGPMIGGWLIGINARGTPAFGTTAFWTGSAFVGVALLLVAPLGRSGRTEIPVDTASDLST